jgi:ankyrin repeat protein
LIDPAEYAYLSQLHVAAAAGNLNAARYLLEAGGVSANPRDEMLETPLMYLATTEPTGWEAIGDLLINYGADPNAEDIHDETAMSMAAKVENWGMLHWLLRMLVE